jgi:hypothetical protein
MTNITIPPEALEAAAEDIYNHWQFSFTGKVPWVKGGNSLMQEKARDLARAACLAVLREWPGMNFDYVEDVICLPLPLRENDDDK